MDVKNLVMIQSMTGYGKAEINLVNRSFAIEIKSLNSKQIDINIIMPNLYRDKEISIRNLLSKKLQRGKIELSVWKETTQISPNYNFFKDIHIFDNGENYMLSLDNEIDVLLLSFNSNLLLIGIKSNNALVNINIKSE